MTASTTTPSAATARDAEVALLARCCAAARGDVAAARNQREANAFRVAAMLMYTRFPSESARLMHAGERYFAAHPCDLLDNLKFFMKRFRGVSTKHLHAYLDWQR